MISNSILLCALLAVFVSVATSCPPIGVSGDYTYDPSSPSGPAGWGNLPGYGTCNSGSSQSPIDVITSGSSPLSPTPAPSYGLATMELKKKVENWALECKTPNTCGSLSYDGQDFDVFNIHFHAPSEHTIDGKKYPLEAHIVHLNGGQIKVMAFLFEVGLIPNTFPALVINSICLGSKTMSVALGLLLDTTKGMCTYNGSLTTPPCSETVQFFIQRKILKVTQTELNNFITTFNSPVNANSRPVQPLNGRSIMCST